MLNDQGAFPVHSNFVPIPLCLLSFCLLSFRLHMKSVLFFALLSLALAAFCCYTQFRCTHTHMCTQLPSHTHTYTQLLCTGSEIIKYVLFANSNFRHWFGLDDSAPVEHRFSLPHTPHTHTHTHAYTRTCPALIQRVGPLWLVNFWWLPRAVGLAVGNGQRTATKWRQIESSSTRLSIILMIYSVCNQKTHLLEDKWQDREVRRKIRNMEVRL